MKDTNFHTALLAVSLDPAAAATLTQQLAVHLRALILSGRAHPGQVLPASRALAEELSVSRTTVISAYDQLMAEGYLETRQGAGTFVAENLPDPAPPRPTAPKPHGLPERAPVPPVLPLHPGVPDLSLFPHRLWARLLHDCWADPSGDLLAPGDPQGLPALRRAIAAHLSVWRGVECDPEQIIVTSGAVEAMELIARALLRPGDRVLIEEPGFAPFARLLGWHGLQPVHVAVDEAGLDISTAPAGARMAVVTPSHHYPLGMTLPLSRRLALIDWARRNDGLIVEDDYDSEFRYRGAPLPALAGADAEGRTIYLGSFSKVLSGALRLSFMVVPPRHLSAIRAALEAAGPKASLVPQPALARLIESGGFATHLRRMRRSYARRQEVLLDGIATHLAGLLTTTPAPAGMHLVCRLSPECLARGTDQQHAERARRAGLGPRALSAYYHGTATRQGLVLGYAAFDEAVLMSATRRLAEVLTA